MDLHLFVEVMEEFHHISLHHVPTDMEKSNRKVILVWIEDISLQLCRPIDKKMAQHVALLMELVISWA
jgi:hypothetical protein